MVFDPNKQLIPPDDTPQHVRVLDLPVTQSFLFGPGCDPVTVWLWVPADLDAAPGTPPYSYSGFPPWGFGPPGRYFGFLNNSDPGGPLDQWNLEIDRFDPALITPSWTRLNPGHDISPVGTYTADDPCTIPATVHVIAL